jgi:Zn-dependent protease with chaperone function
MTEMTLNLPATDSAVRVARYETEIPFLIVVILLSIALWIFVAVSIVGIFYAFFFAIFFFMMHVAFAAHLRGSSIRIGPEQFPELHARITRIASRFGIKRVPDAYLMQSGGVLNALAMKLFRSHFIVIYSQLLEACGDDDHAADFIIAHELGHVKAGHLSFQWLLIGRVFPFIGTAYSRAREYTADRYGTAIAEDKSGAVRGLTILAAGPAHAKHVNLTALMRQRGDMNSILMTLGRWMATHPPIVDRIAAADRALAGERVVAPAPAVLGATALIALVFMVPLAGGGYLMKVFMDKAKEAAAHPNPPQPAVRAPQQTHVADVPAAVAIAQRDMQQLAAVANHYRDQTGRYPEDTESLYAIWRLEHPRDPELRDPFDGERYAYLSGDGTYDIWSAGDERKDVHVRMHVTSQETTTAASGSAQSH